MATIYKHGNDNFKMMTLLFILQIVLGLLPVLLLLVYIGFGLNDNVLVGYIFIAVMAVAGVANFFITKRYNVLASGFRGEKNLMKAVKKLDSGYTVFANIPIRYKKNRSELDLMVLSEKYIMIIEVKNHSGYIYGKHRDEEWLQRKIYRNGKTVETAMHNPIKQMRRQRDIVKSILQANGLDQWVDTVLYFSAPTVHLYLDLYDNDNICTSEAELLDFLKNYKSPKPVDQEKLEAIKKLFREMC